jgi:hypothetical protein
MSDRIQFNIRLDKHPELYEAIKGRADGQGLTLNVLEVGKQSPIYKRVKAILDQLMP